MKKYILPILCSFLVAGIVSAFTPATLFIETWNGIKKQAVYSQEQADKLFKDGYKLYEGELLGTSVTTINGTDTLSASRTTINDNFAALNNGKLEASSYFSTTTHATITTLPALTTASALTTIGTLGSLTLSSALTVANGGTGRTSLTSGQLIYGSGANAPISVATTTPTFGLGFTGGGIWTVLGSAPTLNLATSSLYTGATNQLAYFSGTNTITGFTNTINGYVLSLTGGVPTWVATSSIQNLTTSFPLTISGTSLSFNGLSTSTSAIIGNIPYFSSANAFANVATTTPTFNLGLTVGGTWNVLGSAPTLTLATSSFYTGTTGQLPYFSGTNALIGTSTVNVSTASKVGISSTTPWAGLSIGTAGATSTISTGYFCLAAQTETGTLLYIRLNPTQSTVFATSTNSCF